MFRNLISDNNFCMKVKKNKLLKIIFYLTSVCLLICATMLYNFNYISFYKIFNTFEVKEVCVVCNKDEVLSTFNNHSTNIIQSGSKNFVYLNSFLNNKQFNNADYIQLEVCAISNDILQHLFDFGANLVFTENIESSNVFYLYIPLLPKYKYIIGKRVNIQIVSNENNCLVGYPMIYTAY